MLDNLNTHNPVTFCRFFPPDEAHAYLDRFEFHYTPKHGSWLNMAEIGYCLVNNSSPLRRACDCQALNLVAGNYSSRRKRRASAQHWLSPHLRLMEAVDPHGERLKPLFE